MNSSLAFIPRSLADSTFWTILLGATTPVATLTRRCDGDNKSGTHSFSPEASLSTASSSFFVRLKINTKYIRRKTSQSGLLGKTENVGASWLMDPHFFHYMAALKEYMHGKIHKVAKSGRAKLGSYPSLNINASRRCRVLMVKNLSLLGVARGS